MSQTKHQIEEILNQIGSSPRQRFGQNFMIDRNLVRLVAQAGELAAADLAIEVGPGTGTLTEELLDAGASVLAVEIDRDLAAMLRTRFARQTRFELIEGDALAGKHQLHPDLSGRIARERSAGRAVKLGANLPYNIASPLVIELLIAGVELLAFTVQREVAQRLKAIEGDDAYGPLSVMANLLCEVEVLRTLPPQAFWPAPSVDSALVRMRRHDRLGDDAGGFGTFVHAIFSYRRKTLRKALSEAGLDSTALLEASGLEPTLRPEQLSPATFLWLYRLNRSVRER